MGLMDDVKKAAAEAEQRARGLVSDNGEKLEAGIDKLAALAKDKAGPGRADKIESGAAKAKEAIKKFGKGDAPDQPEPGAGPESGPEPGPGPSGPPPPPA
jgi:hypothetical protein